MSKRIGLLLLLLVFPVLVYLFLKFFGQNRYTLPKYFPQDVVENTLNGKTVSDTIFHKIPDFSFLSNSGDTVTQEISRDKIYVADFFFTTCPGICPQMSSQLKRVQEAFIDNPDILILSHTVDPETDTKEVLDAYAKKYKAIPGKWFFMTGEKNKIYDLAQKGYFISALEDSNYSDADRFIHSDKLILVDKDKQIRGYYNGTDEKDVDRLILEISVLLDGYAKRN
ncbi:MAG: SCO family protein [Opitutaceae bacterium]|nr:SCO family protein [Cytophagales bacterium]